MQNFSINGLSLRVGCAGSGPPLLFITGTAGDLRNPNSPLNSPLTDRFSVASYDQRGMGQSDKPDQPYTMLDYARDAIGVLDALRWSSVAVAGYSFGGMVAQEVAIRWPERVSRLVLMATTAGGDGGKSYPIEEFEQMPEPERSRQRLQVIDLSFTPEWQSANPRETETRIQTRIDAEHRFADEPGHSLGRRLQLAARSQHNTYDRLDRITAPTLVIAGMRDGQAPMAAQRAMSERINDCRFECIDGSHQMLWESPKVFNLVRDFLDTRN